MGLSEWPEHFIDDKHDENEYIIVEFERELQIEVITKEAIGFYDGDPDDLIWIPKSQLENPDQYKPGMFVDNVTMTQWIAEQKNLI